MSDESTRLYAAKAAAWMQEFGADLACQVCRATNWAWGNVAVSTHYFPGNADPFTGPLGMKGPTMPVVELVCRRCGLVLHIREDVMPLPPPA